MGLIVHGLCACERPTETQCQIVVSWMELWHVVVEGRGRGTTHATEVRPPYATRADATLTRCGLQ